MLAKLTLKNKFIFQNKNDNPVYQSRIQRVGKSVIHTLTKTTGTKLKTFFMNQLQNSNQLASNLRGDKCMQGERWHDYSVGYILLHITLYVTSKKLAYWKFQKMLGNSSELSKLKWFPPTWGLCLWAHIYN